MTVQTPEGQPNNSNGNAFSFPNAVTTTSTTTNPATFATGTNDQATPAGRFTEADIENARKQEKDKLYSKLEDWEAKFTEQGKQLAAIQKEREEAAKAAEDQRATVEEAQRKKSEEEMSAKDLLAKKDSEWAQRFTQLEQQREQERLVFEKERQFNELRDYAQTLVSTAVNAGEVAPELVDFVTGNTREEIEANLARVKEKTNAIAQNIEQSHRDARASMKGVSATGHGTTGPLDANPGTQQYSVEDLQNMPMSEWAKIRGTLIPASSSGANRGLYG